MTLAVLGLILMNSADTSTIIEQSWSRTLVVGHRGAAAYEPENTLPSFESAIESGAVAAECDVHVSSNGHVMVMHDATLGRTTSLKGRVDQTPSWTMIDAGVPTLGQLCDLTRGRIVLIVEIKGGVGVSEKVVEELRSRKMVEESIVFSFDQSIVSTVKQLNPAQFTVWLVGSAVTTRSAGALLKKKKDLGVDAIGMHYANVTKPVSIRLREERVPLFIWTVPPGDQVDRLKALGVNFIITNHPRDVREQLAKS